MAKGASLDFESWWRIVWLPKNSSGAYTWAWQGGEGDYPPISDDAKSYALVGWEARAAGLSHLTDAEVNAEFKRRNPPPPNPQAPTMKGKARG